MVENKELCQRAKTFFIDLGSSADEIAENLIKGGYKGTMGDSEGCVLYRRAHEEFPDEHVAVGSVIEVDGCSFVKPLELATVEDGPDYVDPDHILPAHIWDFMNRFDRNEWPALVDPANPSIDNDDEDDWDDDLDDEDDDDFDDDEDDLLDDEDDDDDDEDD